MGKYVDIMVTPVPKRVTASYTRLSRTFGKIWREHGALEYRESIADDVSVGKRTFFKRSTPTSIPSRYCASSGQHARCPRGHTSSCITIPQYPR